MLVECYYALEDFVSLGKLMDTLAEGNPLLLSIGDKFQSVGLCTEGVNAFLKVRVCVCVRVRACVCVYVCRWPAWGTRMCTDGLPVL